MGRLCLAAVLAWSVAAASAGEPVLPADATFFETAIRPLLVEHCAECHSADDPSGGLRLDSRGAMLAGGESGPAIAPHESAASLLIEAVRYESYEMPPSGKLPADQIELLARWIDRGAPWPGSGDGPAIRKPSGPTFTDQDRAWWAVQPVADVPPPNVSDADGWVRGDIDRFILRAIRADGLTPAPEAERTALLRRLTFDLIGLPPTPAEVEVFLSDRRPDAYERVVDDLLARPEFGERQARHWLDLVRYADSDGYKNDHFRPHAWRYRDYVIRSLNDDKPYDRFVREQLAADELYPGDPEALVGLGYLRSGIYEHNSRDVFGQYDLMLNELTDTTGDVFLGMGMQCARCHDHKFDPIRQRDYFALRAYFEPVSFRDDLLLASEAEIAEHARRQGEWEQATAALRTELDALDADLKAELYDAAYRKFAPEIQTIIDMPAADRDARQQQIFELAWRQVDEEYAKLDAKRKGEHKTRAEAILAKLAAFDDRKPKPLPVARAVTDVRPGRAGLPTTAIPKKRTEVAPAVPSLLAELGTASPAVVPIVPESSTLHDATLSALPGGSSGRRAALAEWITDPANPLATRVIANRIWQHHFGRGLAPNGSDFGQLGGEPSHPQLLDHLVGRLLHHGWRLKPLHREIVLSATYRQSATHPRADEFEAIDPENVRYWRSPTRRLDAEQVRDALLAVSGQLRTHRADNGRRGGPGATHNAPVRSIYLKVVRNKRHPLLAVFDLPQFFVSAASRDTTTTTIQSLLLINSERMLGHSHAMAARLIGEHDADEPRLRAAWLAAFGREPADDELSAATDFLDRQAATIDDDGQREALADLCHVLLNASEFLYVE